MKSGPLSNGGPILWHKGAMAPQNFLYLHNLLYIFKYIFFKLIFLIYFVSYILKYIYINA